MNEQQVMLGIIVLPPILFLIGRPDLRDKAKRLIENEKDDVVKLNIIVNIWETELIAPLYVSHDYYAHDESKQEEIMELISRASEVIGPYRDYLDSLE